MFSASKRPSREFGGEWYDKPENRGEAIRRGFKLQHSTQHHRAQTAKSPSNEQTVEKEKDKAKSTSASLTPPDGENSHTSSESTEQTMEKQREHNKEMEKRFLQRLETKKRQEPLSPDSQSAHPTVAATTAGINDEKAVSVGKAGPSTATPSAPDSNTLLEARVNKTNNNINQLVSREIEKEKATLEKLSQTSTPPPNSTQAPAKNFQEVLEDVLNNINPEPKLTKRRPPAVRPIQKGKGIVRARPPEAARGQTPTQTARTDESAETINDLANKVAALETSLSPAAQAFEQLKAQNDLILKEAEFVEKTHLAGAELRAKEKERLTKIGEAAQKEAKERSALEAFDRECGEKSNLL
jgi:hypothetical protein